jgi:chemotaxis methyl-accepting protein methylase
MRRSTAESEIFPMATMQPESQQAMDLSVSVDGVLEIGERRYHTSLRHYRRRFLSRRIQSRMYARSLTSHEAYVQLLNDDADEYAALLDALSINVSTFMRDAAAYQALSDQALAPLINERRHSGARDLTIWSVGCSKGEEPYSVAMLLLDLLGATRDAWRLVIHASDVNERALAEARQGLYTEESFRDTGTDYIERYFTPVNKGYQIARRLQDMLTWRHQDLRITPPLPHYDVILCRNVLIYYDHMEQASMISHLLDHLAPGGYLMLGMVEMVPTSQAHRLRVVDLRSRLYRKVEEAVAGNQEVASGEHYEQSNH